MSVLIKGMEAPRDCYECEFAYTLDGCCHCSLLHDGCVETYIDKRAEDCPMVEIPTEHGRLIDADMLDTAVMNMNDAFPYNITRNDYTLVKRVLNHIPTVVPAEKGGAE